MDCLLLDGDIEEYQPTTEINNLIKANRIQEKVKRENRTKWTINVDFADFCHMKRLTDVHLLGENQLFISDYRKDAFDKTILDKPVILSESISLTPLYRSERQKGSFQVENKIVDAISRFGFVNASGEVNLSEIPLPNFINNPIDLTVNSEPFLTGLIENTNIGLVDQDGNDLEFTVDGLDLVVEVSGGSSFPIKSGQTISYATGDISGFSFGREVDFFILNFENHFGHSFRFCGINGGYTDGLGYFLQNGSSTTKSLAFPEQIVLDFGMFEKETGRVVGMHSTPQSYGFIQWANCLIQSASFSPTSYPSGWFQAGTNVLRQLYYQPFDTLQFMPFEITAGTGFIASADSLRAPNTGRFKRLEPFNRCIDAVKATNTQYPFPIRIFNISEL
jgi:hypothetical protein